MQLPQVNGVSTTVMSYYGIIFCSSSGIDTGMSYNAVTASKKVLVLLL